MATTRANAIILTAARRLKAPRVLPTTDVRPYTSAILVDYMNRAVIDIVAQALKEKGVAGTANLFPEFMKPSSILTLTAGAVAKPTDAFAVVELMKSDGSIYITRQEAAGILKIVTGYDVLNVPSATDPIFWEENGQIKTLPTDTAVWQVIAKYLQCPAAVTIVTGAGGTDLLINSIWDGDIVNKMVEYGLMDAKNGVLGGAE